MKLRSQSGGVLLATLSFIILLAVAAASVLELTMNSYKLTMRNEQRAQARVVAESELDYVYYQFMTQIMLAVPADLTPAALSGICDQATVPTTVRSAYLAAHRAQGWRVMRAITYNSVFDRSVGLIPGTTKRGTVVYITVYIEVLPPANTYFANELTVRVGRRFASSTTSIFQYGVFYQGDLEFQPGGNVTITGDISANGSIYMGASGGGVLTLNGQVRYMGPPPAGYFNQDSLGNTVLRKPNTPVGGALSAPVFSTSQASQLETLSEPENLLGGLDAGEVMARRPDLFPTENDVYRSMILPPPDQTDEYPTADSTLGDDATISAQRVYNRAGLRVTVNPDNSITITKADGTDVTSTYSSAIVSTANMYDQRETKNVKMTTIDVGTLTTLLAANYPTFNGVFYVNSKGSNSSTPGGVKLINAATVPSGNGTGFSLATNGGVYVQGDYNITSPALADGSRNPAMLMADAVTVLSAGWQDANASSSNISVDRVASASVTVNAGILTGNTPASSTVASGGAQNLIRYMEQWTGMNVTLNGSLGRLYQANSFIAPFQQPGVVYRTPAARSFNFDTSLRDHPPAGSPITTAFSRGTFFVW